MTAMDTPCSYDIVVEGPLAVEWSGWFADLTVHTGPDGQTHLSGPIPDQAALHGVLIRIRDLNLILVSLQRRPLALGG